MKSQNKIVLGIGYMALSIMLSSFFMVIVKWMSSTYTIMEIIFFRNFFASFICLPLILRKNVDNKFYTSNLKYHILHAMLGLLAMFLYFTSISLLPLAKATAIFFSVPLFVTIFSTVILNEKVNINCWIAIMVGFIGTLVVINPEAISMSKGEIIAMLTAITTSLALITVRYLGKKEGSLTTTFYYTIFSTIALVFVLPLVWKKPTDIDLIILMLLGIGSGIEQIIMTYSYKLCPAAVVAPVGYTSLIWAAIFGAIFWKERLNANIVLGSLIIICCTLYVYRFNIKNESQLVSTTNN
ncbi:MAG TPA: DMT family transporter [Gammaproteobacteria bacterium]|nr:DMT family transporter [Gammaproteobacteria bacterium]